MQTVFLLFCYPLILGWAQALEPRHHVPQKINPRRDLLVQEDNHTVQGHVLTTISSMITSVVFRPNLANQSLQLATGSVDNVVDIWELEQHSLLYKSTFPGYHTGGLESVAYNSDGTLLLSSGHSLDDAGGYPTVSMGNATTGNVERVFMGHDNSVHTASLVLPDETEILSQSPDQIRIVDVNSGHLWFELRSPQDCQFQFAEVSPDGETLCVVVSNETSGRGYLQIMDHASMDYQYDPFMELETPYPLRNLAFSPNSNYVATGSGEDEVSNGTVTVWGVTTGKKLRILTGHTAGVQDLKFRADGRHLASASEDGSVKIWNLVDGSLVDTLQGHVGAVNSIDWSPDGMILVSAGDDTSLREWDLDPILPPLDGTYDVVLLPLGEADDGPCDDIFEDCDQDSGDEGNGTIPDDEDPCNDPNNLSNKCNDDDGGGDSRHGGCELSDDDDDSGDAFLFCLVGMFFSGLPTFRMLFRIPFWLRVGRFFVSQGVEIEADVTHAQVSIERTHHYRKDEYGHTSSWVTERIWRDMTIRYWALSRDGKQNCQVEKKYRNMNRWDYNRHSQCSTVTMRHLQSKGPRATHFSSEFDPHPCRKMVYATAICSFFAFFISAITLDNDKQQDEDVESENDTDYVSMAVLVVVIMFLIGLCRHWRYVRMVTRGGVVLQKVPVVPLRNDDEDDGEEW